MGLIFSAANAISSTLSDQWKEYFYCDAIPSNVICVRGHKKNNGIGNLGSDDVITDGSKIAVADGQCMLIVEQGQVVDICAEPGLYEYRSDEEPSVFLGPLDASVKSIFNTIGKRFQFGGSAAQNQRVYYFNTKEITGNKYGTANPIPFRVVDQRIGLDIDISIRAHGEYSYKVIDPFLFYQNVCGNFDREFERDEIDSQLKTELLTALQPALAKISAMGVRYSDLPGHTFEIADALNEVLSEKWQNTRGIEIVSFGISSVSASKEDEDMIKNLQRTAVYRDPGMAAANLSQAQAQAMQSAAANTATGPMFAFQNMAAANNMGGMNANTLYQMSAQQSMQQQSMQQQSMQQQSMQQQPMQQQPVQQQPVQQPVAPAQSSSWTCSCGAVNSGNFCSNCGKPKPQPSSWTCSCGTENTGNFCCNCGKPRA